MHLVFLMPNLNKLLIYPGRYQRSYCTKNEETLSITVSLTKLFVPTILGLPSKL